ncbi:MAG: hypothetical protein QME51_08400 [Planctomycetota bacterium]|nr:hypothetical protein [Planctomycetota bacterium]MDI6788377.1 hypothetical protein [Planctomycetota bacterium]
MLPEQPTDEALIDAYRAGNKNALNVLFSRYLKPLKSFLFKKSWFKGHSYLDDVLQDIFLIAFSRLNLPTGASLRDPEAVLPGQLHSGKGITENKFTDKTPNSFRKYLYAIAHKECIKQDERQSRLPQPLSQVFPDDEKGIAESPAGEAEGEDDSGTDDNPLPTACGRQAFIKGEYEESNYDDLRNRAEEILAQLSLQEQQLIRLLSQGKSYKEIRQEPSFSKYSIDYLMRKAYLIRKKVYKISIKYKV